MTFQNVYIEYDISKCHSFQYLYLVMYALPVQSINQSKFTLNGNKWGTPEENQNNPNI